MADILMGVDSESDEVLDTEESTLETEDDNTELSSDGDENVDETNEEETEEPEETEEELSWAKALGVDDSKLVVSEKGTLEGINVKVDGKVETVPLNDVIAGYQTNKSNTNKSQAIAAERKELEEVRKKAIETYTIKLDEVSLLANHLEARLIGDFQGVNWEKLRYENPAEYAALAQDFQVRSAEIERVKASVQNEKKVQEEVLTTEQQQAMADYLKVQAAKVVENNPTWAKPEVAKKNLSEIKDFITSTYGFDENDFASIQDARIIEVLKDAKAYREGAKVAEKKMAKPIPKFQKSSVATKKSTAADKVANLQRAAKVEKNITKKRALENEAIARLLMGN